jgi:hypothetical protein
VIGRRTKTEEIAMAKRTGRFQEISAAAAAADGTTRTAEY